ncbi:MAG: TIGR02757 family protein [Bacteroidota bacterium]|nr:TIGR02757 family protein [Bacteroidota bacterium]
MNEELKAFLDQKYIQYNNPSFIECDPVSVPHLFERKEDIEISAFLTSTLSWGKRKSIIKNSGRLIHMMDDRPFDFITHASPQDLKPIHRFVHRTFNGEDAVFFISSLKNIYQNHGGLEAAFSMNPGAGIKEAIVQFRKLFFSIEHSPHVEKHLADPSHGSTAKRVNMFLRWMVRDDGCGVDFGLWKKMRTADLFCPLDVHSGNTARYLGILTRKSNDWKAVEELTTKLREFDPEDPVKYDFALFGIEAIGD